MMDDDEVKEFPNSTVLVSCNWKLSVTINWYPKEYWHIINFYPDETYQVVYFLTGLNTNCLI